MFNGMPFNAAPYNRSKTAQLFVESAIESGTEVESSVIKRQSTEAAMESGGQLESSYTRRLALETSNVEGSTEIDVEMEVSKIFGAIIIAGSEVTGDMTLHYLLDNAEMFAGAEFGGNATLHRFADSEMLGGAQIIAAEMNVYSIAESLMESGADFQGQFTMRANSEALLEGGGELSAGASMRYGAEGQIEAGATLQVEANQILSLSSRLEAGAEVTANASAKYSSTSLLQGSGEFIADFEATRLEVMEAAVKLEPGDILVIDTCEYTATLNGQNVMESIKAQLSDWLKISPESIELIVEGAQTGNLDVKVDVVPVWK